jgi:hypothetical protein
MSANIPSTLTPEVLVLITDWFRRARESQRTHYVCSTRSGHWNYILGIPAIILSAIVGTAIFASLSENNPAAWIKILAGCISVLAAVLASLQTFLKYSELADAHREAGAKYGAIRRTLELLKTLPPATNNELKGTLDQIKAEMDRLAAEAPAVSSGMKAKIDKALKGREHKRIFHLPGSNSA